MTGLSPPGQDCKTVYYIDDEILTNAIELTCFCQFLGRQEKNAEVCIIELNQTILLYHKKSTQDILGHMSHSLRTYFLSVLEWKDCEMRMGRNGPGILSSY